MIELGIDEATLVLSPAYEDALTDRDTYSSWEDIAGNLAAEAARRLNLVSVYGNQGKLSRFPSGYNAGICFGEHDFYFGIAWNMEHPAMGVVVKFSAQSLAWYTHKTGREFWQLIQEVQSPLLYVVRPSRIDVTADFIDEGMSVDDIYRRLDSGELTVYRKQRDPEGEVQLRRSASKMRGYFSGSTVETVYLGSMKKNTRALLRIYDKKAEQIANSGTRELEARRCSDWVRFEASLRHHYARQFGDALEACRSNDDFALCICKLYNDRYLFMESGGTYAPWTVALGAYDVDSSGLLLSSPSLRKADLAASAAYIATGSGLFPLLYKAESIWGEDAPAAILDKLAEWYAAYTPNADAQSWLRKNAWAYSDEFPTVYDWLEEATGILES